MSEEVLPSGSYLASRYHDRRRRLQTGRVYYEDGRVEAFDGRRWWIVCRFSPEQVTEAKAAVRESGLLAAHDLTAQGVFDTAALTYAWNLDSERGSVTNWAYPARQHPAFVALEKRLRALEEAAGAEPA